MGPETESRSPETDSTRLAEQIVRRSGTSFFWAMRCLPVKKRQAMYAVYAFCRDVDDIADEPGDETRKRNQLESWRGEIKALYQGRASTELGRALLPVIERYGVREDDFLAVIDGMEMDAGPRFRMTDKVMLDLYCDRVACAVGRLSIRVFGVSGPDGDAIAKALGNALQLTNILRDIEEDALRDRLYIPEDILRKHSIPVGDPADVINHPGFSAIFDELCNQAEKNYIEARQLLSRQDRSIVRPAVMMMEVYQRLLVKMRLRGWQPGSKKIRLPLLVKLWLVLRFGVF